MCMWLLAAPRNGLANNNHRVAVARDEKAEGTVTGNSSTESNPRSRSERLVVDDSMAVRCLLHVTLAPIGAVLAFTGNSEKTMALSRRGGHDIILLKILLHRIDGSRVCGVGRGDKLAKDTPVLVYASRGSAIDEVRDVMAGSSVCRTKLPERNEPIQAVDMRLSACSLARLRASVRSAA